MARTISFKPINAPRTPTSPQSPNGLGNRPPFGALYATPLHPSSSTTVADEDVKMNEFSHTAESDVGEDDDDVSLAPEEVSVPIRSTPATSDNAMQDSLGIVGSRVKELLHAIKELDHHGIDHSVPLPKIVVVGDQSAGKSSLIEAISEIKVPRKSGTCTRCPLQINLTTHGVLDNNSPWTAVVSLIKKYDYCTLPNEDPDTGMPYPLYPWVKKTGPPTTTRFHSVHKKEDLEEVIKFAQLMILNPQFAPKDFQGAKGHIPTLLRKVEFSPNVISLDITAPNIPDLSFYDLPGVISQAEDGTKGTVVLVENLVREYIQQENTLILLAVSMESDIDNSKTSGILNDEHANDRCIGVLTKPDRLPSDERGTVWQKVLSGRAFKKGHGYFVVKQPEQRDLDRGITHEQARAAEDQYFATNPDWTRRFPTFHDRLGTRQLQEALSQKLAALIVDSLPNVTEKIQVMLTDIAVELHDLPDPPPNALHVVNEVLGEFYHVFRQRIDGERVPNDLSKAWKGIRGVFEAEITEIQNPSLIVFEPRKPVVITLDSSDDEKQTPTATPSKMTATPSKRRKMQPSDASSVGSPSPMKGKGKAVPPTKKRFELVEIRDTLDDFCSSGLPGDVELKAVDNLILMTLKNWDGPTYELIRSVHTVLRDALHNTLNETARMYSTTALFREIQRISEHQFLENQVGVLRSTTVPRALRLERSKPIITDKATLERFRHEALDTLQNARFRSRTEAWFDEQDAMTGKDTSPAERERKRRQEKDGLKAKLGPDRWAREIEVMAKIRAYYRIASMRFIDNIRQSVEAELFEEFRRGLKGELIAGLRVTGPDCHDHCASLLEDDPVRAQRRQELKQLKRSLEQAIEHLDELRNENGTFSAVSQEL